MASVAAVAMCAEEHAFLTLLGCALVSYKKVTRWTRGDCPVTWHVQDVPICLQLIWLRLLNQP